MTFSSRTSAILIVLCVLLPQPPAGMASRPLPDAGELMHDVREAVRLDEELQTGFTYLEQRRDLKVSRLGKVTVGPLRTFEVHPSTQPGRTYKRLIAVDGVPLDAAELSRRDAERRRDVEDAAARERAETPEQRAARLREAADERRKREAILDDALAVYEAEILGRETLDGEPVIVAALTPRQSARVTSREGRWMKQFAGRIWVSELDHQIARFDMRALDDISMGWGILGRVHEGSRFVFARRKIEGVWLPAEVTFEATGRTLLFRKFEIRTVTTYSDYRRANAGRPASVASTLRDDD